MGESDSWETYGESLAEAAEPFLEETFGNF